jgi:hypothetical protein
MSIESRPLNHGLTWPHEPGWSDACGDCVIEQRLACRWPEIGPWEIVGEGVARGQWFVRDQWKYVLISDLRSIDVAAEMLEPWHEGGHEEALRALVGAK